LSACSPAEMCLSDGKRGSWRTIVVMLVDGSTWRRLACGRGGWC
jgi:hypothetical protein